MLPFSRPIAQCVCAVDQRLIAVDQHYADVMREMPAAMIGRHPLEFTHVDDRPGNAALLDRLCHDGTPFSITKRYVRRDGSIQWVNNHLSRLREGGIDRLIVTCRPLDHPTSPSAVEHHWRVAKLLLQGFLDSKAAFGSSLITSPSAEMLLLLYAAEVEGRSETVASAAAHMALAAPLARRWVEAMAHAGLVETEAGAALRLTPDAMAKIENILMRLAGADAPTRD